MIGRNGVTPKRKRAERDRVDPITSAVLRKLVEDQNYKCALTGRDLSPEVASVDHIIPLSRGGSHAIENLQVIFNSVNQAKGTMTNDEFIAMCHEVVRYTDGNV